VRFELAAAAQRLRAERRYRSRIATFSEMDQRGSVAFQALEGRV